ncbi:MAG: hypothetical protein FWE32_09220 [Oscillospiraceae bacterium]|nr:hypothetical protein [Oscillospiraceae bacterium]
MKVKVFEAVTASGLEKQMNAFLAESNITVLDMKYMMTTSSHGVLLTYEDKQKQSAVSRHEMDQ